MDDKACDVEQVGVAVVHQVAGDAVGLLVDHGRDAGADLGFVEDVVLAEFRGDLLVVGVLGQLARNQVQRVEVFDRLRLGQDAALELVGDPETLAGLEELLRVVGGDGVELDVVVDQLQHGRLGSRRLIRKPGAQNALEMGFPRRAVVAGEPVHDVEREIDLRLGQIHRSSHERAEHVFGHGLFSFREHAVRRVRDVPDSPQRRMAQISRSTLWRTAPEFQRTLSTKIPLFIDKVNGSRRRSGIQAQNRPRPVLCSSG